MVLEKIEDKNFEVIGRRGHGEAKIHLEKAGRRCSIKKRCHQQNKGVLQSAFYLWRIFCRETFVIGQFNDVLKM